MLASRNESTTLVFCIYGVGFFVFCLFFEGFRGSGVIFFVVVLLLLHAAKQIHSILHRLFYHLLFALILDYLYSCIRTQTLLSVIELKSIF